MATHGIFILICKKLVLNKDQQTCNFYRQLLLDCGIGVPPAGQSNDIVINQHRALIFCQLKAMLDILENDLFK